MSHATSDPWADILDARYGDIELHILDTRDDFSQRLQVTSYAQSNRVTVRPLGLEPRRTNVTLVFFDDDQLDHFARFIERVGATPRLFVHPLYGAYEAYIGPLTVSAAAEQAVIVAHAELVQATGEVPAVIAPGFAASATSAREEVRAVADMADRRARDLGLSLESSEPVRAMLSRAPGATSSAAPGAAREIAYADQRVAAEVARLEEDGEPGLASLLHALRRLQSALRRLGQAILRAAPALRTVETATSAPLVIVLQQIYGDGARAADCYERVLELNPTLCPALVPLGVVLVIEE